MAKEAENYSEVKVVDISLMGVIGSLVILVAILGWLYPMLVSKMHANAELEPESEYVEGEELEELELPYDNTELGEVDPGLTYPDRSTMSIPDQVANNFTVEHIKEISEKDASRFEIALRKRTRTGTPGSEYMLAKFYQIVRNDSNKAFVWMNRGAMAGDVRAMADVAKLYEYGEGTRRSSQKAYAWFTIAEGYGDVGSAEKRKILIQRISAEEIKRGHRTATTLFKQITGQ